MEQEETAAAGEGQGRRGSRASQAGRDRPATDHRPGKEAFLTDTPAGVDLEALDAAIHGSGSLAPTGPELAYRNRRILAARLGWPDGAVEACERFDAAHDGWFTNWRGDPAPGFYAIRAKRRDGEPAAYGATVAELAAAVETWRYHDPWEKPFVPL